MTIQIQDQPFVHNCGTWCNRPEAVAVRTSSMDEADFRVEQIACEGFGDASLSNGIIRSSKEVTALDDGTFQVWHGIDDSYTYFTKEALADVFRGKRDIWNGDLDD